MKFHIIVGSLYVWFSSGTNSFIPEYSTTVQYAQLQPYQPPLGTIQTHHFAPPPIPQDPTTYQPNADLIDRQTNSAPVVQEVVLQQHPHHQQQEQPGSNLGQNVIVVPICVEKKKKRKPYSKRGGPRERVNTEDSSIMKRIAICPEKVLEILQVTFQPLTWGSQGRSQEGGRETLS